METKPFNIQSPEQIAKDYGGNKQRIAQAMQMGILDPTAGTLAGMFIDRMRSAAQAEAAPQQSVAQQVFTPPAPQMPQGVSPMSAGLGATPEAAAMPVAPSLPSGAGQPLSPSGLPGVPQAPAVGMAAGGLTTLPIPDGMFDEPGNGGYRGGGLVAFAAGSPGELIDDEEEEEALPSDTNLTGDDQILVTTPPNLRPTYKQPVMAVLPPYLGGFAEDLPENLRMYGEAAPRETRRATEYQEYLDRLLSPEEQRARRQEDMWMALGQIGARMATTPGSLLQAVSTGIGEALPGIREAAAARRGEERSARQALVGEERTGNQEVAARANVALDMLRNYNTLAEALQDRTFENLWRSLDRATQERIARVNANASMYGANKNYEASVFGSRLGYNERRAQLASDFGAQFDEAAQLDIRLRGLRGRDPAEYNRLRDEYVLPRVNQYMPPIGGTGGGTTAASGNRVVDFSDAFR